MQNDLYQHLSRRIFIAQLLTYKSSAFYFFFLCRLNYLTLQCNFVTLHFNQEEQYKESENLSRGNSCHHDSCKSECDDDPRNNV